MEWRLIKKSLDWFACEMIPCISLNCKLVSFQYREYEYGLLYGKDFHTAGPRKQTLGPISLFLLNSSSLFKRLMFLLYVVFTD